MAMTVTERVASHRSRMKAKGFRELRIWVPDPTSSQFQTDAAAWVRNMNAANAADRGLDEFLGQTAQEGFCELDDLERQ